MGKEYDTGFKDGYAYATKYYVQTTKDQENKLRETIHLQKKLLDDLLEAYRILEKQVF